MRAIAIVVLLALLSGCAVNVIVAPHATFVGGDLQEKRS